MGCGVGSAAFRDQVVGLGYLWDTWTQAEQVVAIYSLVRRLGPVPSKFLLNVLSHTTQPDQQELIPIEQQANDPAFVSQIPEGKDGGASELLHHLPLLRPTNTEAKLQYLSIIPKVLAHAVTSGVGQPAALENARQLLSYSLIHPAISAEERRALTHWLRALEDRLADLRRPPAHLQHTQGYGNNISRSCSLGPGGAKSRWNDTSHLPPPDTGQDDSGWCGGSSSSGGGGPSMEPPQSPNNSATSSRSSGCDTDDVPPHHHLGMRDVGAWLKSLRLHKYSPLLSNLSYQELLALDEVTLESQGVTKGARHKIVLSIEKLKDRHRSLMQIEKDVMNGGNLSSALNELKSIIITPFPPYNSGSEPSASQYCSVESQHSTSIATSSSSNSTVSSSAAASSPPCTASTTTPVSAAIAAASQSVTAATVYSSSSYTNSPPASSSTTTTAPSSISSSTSSSLCSIRGEEVSRDEYPTSAAAGTKPLSQEPEGGSSTIPEGDLPSQFTRVMGKVCTQLLVCVRPEDECVSAFLGLVEKCLNHEAFTAAHARRLLSWKQQIIRVWHPLPPKNKDIRHNRRWSQQYGGEAFLGGGSFRMGRGSCGSGLGGLGGSSVQRGYPQIPPALLLGATKAFQSPQPHPLFSFSHNGQGLGNLMAQRNSLAGLPSLGNVGSLGGLLSPQQFLAKRPSLQETPSEQLRPHITLQRTRSAPSRPHSSAPTRPHQLPLSRAPHLTQQTASHTQLQHTQLDHRSSSELLKCSLGSVGSSVMEGSSAHFSPCGSYSHLGPSQSATGAPPPSPHQAPTAPPPDSQHDNDITDRLESLCLSVTEHALG